MPATTLRYEYGPIYISINSAAPNAASERFLANRVRPSQLLYLLKYAYESLYLRTISARNHVTINVQITKLDHSAPSANYKTYYMLMVQDKTLTNPAVHSPSSSNKYPDARH